MLKSAFIRKPATGVAISIFLLCAWLNYNSRKDNDRWIFNVYMDGRGYYSYLPAIFIYQDLSFSFYSNNSPHEGDIPNFCVDNDGKKVNKYFPGVAVLLSPFFFIAHLSSHLFGFEPNGYSQLYFMGVGLAAAFYLGLGVLYLARLLRLYQFSEWLIALTLPLMVFGTNLYHYTVYESSMSHVYSFAMCAMFLYYLKKLSYAYSSGTLFLAFAALLLSFMIRPVAGFVLLFAVPFVLYNGSLGFKELVTLLLKDKRALPAVMITGALAIFSVCFIWYKQTGSWIIYSYEGEGFDWLRPHTYDSLLSYRKGWLLYNPIMILALFGLAVVYRRDHKLFWLAALFISVMIYFISAWGAWDYGYCYGLRAYVDYYPFMAILLASFLANITSPAMKLLGGLLLTGLVYLQQVQTWQAEHGIIHYAEMNEQRYRSVFLQTDEKYFNFFYQHPKAQTLADTLADQADNNEVIESRNAETFTGDPKKYTAREVFAIDFETDQNISVPPKIVKTMGAASNSSYRLDSLLDYSPTFKALYASLHYRPNTWVRASVQVYPLTTGTQKDFALVASVASKGEQIKYSEAWLNPRSICIGNWNTLTMDYLLPAAGNENAEIRVYCLNRGAHSVLMDNFKVTLLTPSD